MQFYSTATVTVATCVYVQHKEIRKGGFVKPYNKPERYSIPMKTTNFFMSFS